MTSLWRQFRPRHQPTPLVHTSEVYQHAQDIIEPYHVGKARLWQRHDPHILDDSIAALRAKAESTGDPAVWIAALILQAPRAASAQRQMDKHHGGYQNKQKRLFELIDFNDTFVGAVLALPDAYLTEFDDTVKRMMDQFCKRTGMPCFQNEQWEAITHGLSREIAVYRGAIADGFSAHMTSRREDAMGIDMVIGDPQSGRTLNIDVKTRSSFHFRLIDLEREGRISTEQRMHAELSGYLHNIANGHGAERVHTTLLRIDEETYGRVIDFRFERPEKLGEILHTIIGEDNA